MQDLFADTIYYYIKEKNGHDDKELTGIAATRAAIAEIRAGGGNTFDSVDDLMADLYNDDED